MSDVGTLNQQYGNWLDAGYLATRRAEANQLAVELTEAIDTHTSVAHLRWLLPPDLP